MAFIVDDIDVHPQDTGVSQYITIEATILLPDTMYSKAEGDTEVYSGESVGIL